MGEYENIEPTEGNCVNITIFYGRYLKNLSLLALFDSNYQQTIIIKHMKHSLHIKSHAWLQHEPFRLSASIGY
jgi:hypothetical protein